MTDEMSKWLPDEGEHKLEVATMKEETSRAGNPMFRVHFVSCDDPSNGFEQLLTNIPGKRWLLRQLLEACGIEPEENAEGRKIYNWDISDIEGQTVLARIEHDKTPFIGRDGNEVVIPKPKVAEFKPVK
jgi:hypothetical protein